MRTAISANGRVSGSIWPISRPSRGEASSAGKASAVRPRILATYPDTVSKTRTASTRSMLSSRICRVFPVNS